MNQKLRRGQQPTGTPSLAWSCAVVIVSILAGASVVHNIFKPNLRLIPKTGDLVSCGHDWLVLSLLAFASPLSR
ncbi:unnamed protein product [Ilex paraguariensis]|uniref:Uncharacterized protein n=1 Tax=Ilex paraguariensis TaxID=185542 RepID=A0ABC8SJB3_9AQUA